MLHIHHRTCLFTSAYLPRYSLSPPRTTYSIGPRTGIKRARPRYRRSRCLVIMGVPCALCCRLRIERIYARISAHLGMLGMYIFLSSSCLTATNEDRLFGSNGFVTVKTGITVNALFFCHWMLAAVATKLMKLFLGGAVAYFLFYWIRV